MLTQQWWYLNLTRKSFYILFLAKGLVSYMQVISSHLYIHLFGRNWFTRWLSTVEIPVIN